ncbi:MAG: DedA family protein [Candidatus Saccharimonadales bacterium]
MAAEHVPALISSLAPIVHSYGYLAVGGLIFIESFGVSVPGETMLVAAAFFAGVGQLNIALVILTAFLAAVIGNSIGYFIGLKGGRPLVRKYGRYIFLTPKRMLVAETFFKRGGGLVIIFARFVDGLRQVNGIVAGITKMPWLWFTICNLIGAVLWAGTWGVVGYFGGNHIETIYRYGLYVTGIVLVLGAAYIVFRLARRRIIRSGAPRSRS